MSNVSKNILEEIEIILNHITNSLCQFQSIYSNETEQDDLKNVSHVLKLIEKTRNIYKWSHVNGSFPNTNHSTKYKDVMAEWSALIDDLYWSLFGIDFVFETKESNRIKIIYLKLFDIDIRLKMYTPALC